MMRTVSIATLLALIALAAAPAPAQEDDQPTRNRSIRGLIRDQEYAYSQLEALEAKMRKLSATLRKAGFPEKADNIEKALEKMYEADLRSGMKEIAKFLEGERLHDAVREAEEVGLSLDALIAILESRRDEDRLEREAEKALSAYLPRELA